MFTLYWCAAFLAALTLSFTIWKKCKHKPKSTQIPASYFRSLLTYEHESAGALSERSQYLIQIINTLPTKDQKIEIAHQAFDLSILALQKAEMINVKYDRIASMKKAQKAFDAALMAKDRLECKAVY